MESDKAIRYIQNLDDARSDGQWDQVPEFARKVLKHAPQRKSVYLWQSVWSLLASAKQNLVLVLTAKTEAIAVSTSTHDAPSVLRPLIAPLVDAITQPNDYPEDVFQASVCLAWLHWILQERDQALAQLHDEPAPAYAAASTPNSRSTEWVQVCAIKYAYMKGIAVHLLDEELWSTDKHYRLRTRENWRKRRSHQILSLHAASPRRYF